MAVYCSKGQKLSLHLYIMLVWILNDRFTKVGLLQTSNFWKMILKLQYIFCTLPYKLEVFSDSNIGLSIYYSVFHTFNSCILIIYNVNTICFFKYMSRSCISWLKTSLLYPAANGRRGLLMMVCAWQSHFPFGCHFSEIIWLIS